MGFINPVFLVNLGVRMRQNHPVDFFDDPVVFPVELVVRLVVAVVRLLKDHPVDLPDDPVVLLVDTLVLLVDPVDLLLELELLRPHQLSTNVKRMIKRKRCKIRHRIVPRYRS